MADERAGRPSSPGSTASLRPANKRRVIELLRGASAGEITQAEIARTTGLASATVSNIVRELTATGLVETDPGAGRRGTVVRLSRGAGVVAGLDFGHSHLAVAVATLGGQVLAESRRPLAADHRYADGLDLAAAVLEETLAGVGHRLDDVRTLGLGLPAPVSDGVVRASAILPGWAGIDALAAASDRFGRRVHVDNDANLGALAEHRVGVAQHVDDVIFVKVSSGVGAGLILDGKIFRGAHGSAGELGHLTLDEHGPVCRCGSRGCLEAYVSTDSLLSMMAGQLPRAGVDDVMRAAREGNVAAVRLIEDAGLHLGWGLASVVNLLNPGMVVVGGEMARAGELLLGSARLGLRRHSLADAATTPVVVSELGERASLVGATLMALEQTELIED